MNDRIDLGPAFPPFDSAGRHRTFGVCDPAFDVILRRLPIPNLAPTITARESRRRTSAPRPDSGLPCPGEAVNPLRLFGRGALRRGRGRRRQRRQAGRTMVLSRKGRERALMGKRSGCPGGPVGARCPAGKQRLGARPLPESRRRNSRGVCMARSHPTDLPGTAGVLAGIVDDGAPPRPVARQPRPVRAPVGRRLSQWPGARFARAGEDAGAPRGIARRAHARPRPVLPELPYPGCAGVLPASREARHADGPYPAIAHPRSRIRAPRRPARFSRNSPVPEARPPRVPQIPQLRTRNPGSGNRVASPGSPGIPPSRRPARFASRKSRNCEPAIPDPGDAPARGPARLSRNSRTAPVPEARPPRVPQIPQLRTRNPGSGRRAGARPARLSRNSRTAPHPGRPPVRGLGRSLPGFTPPGGARRKPET